MNRRSHTGSSVSAHGRRLRLGLTAVAGVAVAALALTACSGGDSSGGASEEDVSKITIVYAAPVADHMIPSVAQEKGYFAEQGLDVEVKFLTPSQVPAALVGGEVQFASFASPSYQIPAMTGTALKAVATWEDSFDALLVSAPQYPTLKSLDGKTVAISSPGTFSDLIASMAEDAGGITLNKVPVGTIGNVVSALAGGSVDSAAALSSSHIPVVEQSLPGVHTLLDFRDMKGIAGVSFVGYDRWLSAHPETVKKVITALDKGFQAFKDDREGTIATIAKVTDQTTEAATVAYEDALKALAPTIEPRVDYEKEVLKYLVEDYPDAASFDPAKFIDASYYQAAVGGK